MAVLNRRGGKNLLPYASAENMAPNGSWVVTDSEWGLTDKGFRKTAPSGSTFQGNAHHIAKFFQLLRLLHF